MGTPRPSDAGWGPDDIGPLTGRTAVVTGANSGLGYETAAQLAAHGALVVLACRDPARGRRAADAIGESSPGAMTDVVTLDLASLVSVRRTAARLREAHDRIDLLVNNAGVMAPPYQLTEDGFDLQMATNYLGHFALTGLLLDLLLTTVGSRVVTVSSHLHRLGRLHPDELTGGPRRRRWPAYARSKLADLAFAYELDRRLRAAGGATRSVAAHPGVARSNLVANGPAAGGSSLRRRVGQLGGLLSRSTESGSLPILYAATAADVEGGTYYGPGRHGPARVRSSAAARRIEDAGRLWTASEAATGVVFDFGAARSPVG